MWGTIFTGFQCFIIYAGPKPGRGQWEGKPGTKVSVNSCFVALIATESVSIVIPWLLLPPQVLKSVSIDTAFLAFFHGFFQPSIFRYLANDLSTHRHFSTKLMLITARSSAINQRLQIHPGQQKPFTTLCGCCPL